MQSAYIETKCFLPLAYTQNETQVKNQPILFGQDLFALYSNLANFKQPFYFFIWIRINTLHILIWAIYILKHEFC